MRIGTASARRRAQLLALEPTLSIEPLRGNIDTRLRKRGERGLDAIVLAACGLDRLGLDGEIGLRLDPEVMLPEAGQGALALQVRGGRGGARRAASTTPRRARGSRPSGAAWRSSAAAASPRSRRYHDGVAADGADRGRGRRAGSSAAPAHDPAALAAELIAAGSR